MPSALLGQAHTIAAAKADVAAGYIVGLVGPLSTTYKTALYAVAGRTILQSVVIDCFYKVFAQNQFTSYQFVVCICMHAHTV